MIDFDLFLEWATDRFGEANIKLRHTSHGIEICAQSPFMLQKYGKHDTKFHLWMNPSGGKSKYPDKGSYRCWRTDEMGSLVRLVSEIDHISDEDAEERIGSSTSLRSLEKRVHEFFGHKEETVDLPVEVGAKLIDLPESSYLIDKMAPTHFMRIKARQYLAKRKIPSDGLYVCISGDFKDRIVIPYYNWDGDLIYYNARLMNDRKDTLRYMKCPTEIIRQEEVLYMTSWPRAGSKIYLMEGEFDAITIGLAGLVGCACGGKFLSESQIELIRQYEPVLAFDADDAGLEALVKTGQALLEKGFPKIQFVRPPKVYKDWNKLVVERNIQTLRAYIDQFEKPFTSYTPSMLLANKI